MEYKDFIKPGNKVIFYPMSYDWDWSVDQKIVTIGEHRPYFRDGSPDPQPDEYDDSCYVEIVEDVADEKQIRLEDLFPIEPCDKQVVNNGYEYKQIGKNEELEKAVLLDHDGETWLCLDADTVDELRSVYELDREDLCRLFNETHIGSMFLGDYYNEVGVTRQDACDILEEFGDAVEWDDDLLRPNTFADYILGEGDFESLD